MVLSDQTKMNDNALEEWIELIGQNLNVIEKICNLSYHFEQYSFLSNDQRFFWIPNKLLP